MRYSKMTKQINFDMDGTIANLYGVKDWLPKLMANDPTPYAIADPLVNLQALAHRLNNLQKKGYTICVISWLSKTTTPEYDEKVIKAKREWLRVHLHSVNNSFCIVKNIFHLHSDLSINKYPIYHCRNLAQNKIRILGIQFSL